MFKDGGMNVPLARPDLGDAEIAAVAEVLRSGWVMQGPQVEAFERELGAFTGAPHACAVSSGTAALHLALVALGVRPGDEVVTVSHSFIATANSVRHAGATPVFVDIAPGGFNIDVSRIEATITSKTRAILCVHQFGMPCDLDAIWSLARSRQLLVIEDAACALGSEIRRGSEWQRIGRPHTDAACFSFHPRKLVTTGDGGAIMTANAEVAARLRQLRNHDLGRPDGTFHEIAWNYRLSDLQAAVGRVQLGKLSALLTERRAQVERYRSLLAALPLELPSEPAWARSNWQTFCVLLPDGRDAATIIALLAKHGITTRPGTANAHEQPAYGAQSNTLPHSERATRRGLALPLFPGLTEEQQTAVARALTAAL
jgi:perosamine synthetase